MPLSATSSDAVTSLVAHGANVNTKKLHGGQTALMWAVAKKHADVVKVLIESAADVNSSSAEGFTALMFAVQQNDQAIANVLLTAGANVSTQRSFAATKQEKLGSDCTQAAPCVRWNRFGSTDRGQWSTIDPCHLCHFFAFLF